MVHRASVQRGECLLLPGFAPLPPRTWRLVEVCEEGSSSAREPKPTEACMLDIGHRLAEAQPLSEILWPSNPAALLPCQPPVCTIILCESEMQFSRASVFATKFKNRAGIVPVLCGKIPEVLLFGIIRKHFNSPLTKLHNVKVDERQQQQKQMDENKAPVQLLLFERLKDDAGEFEDKESMTGHGPSLEDIISKHGVPLAASGKTSPHWSSLDYHNEDAQALQNQPMSVAKMVVANSCANTSRRKRHSVVAPIFACPQQPLSQQ
eukprot:CAMPEP_0172913450 /NCGR_PEP_ID=MMETSP1075-20121228/190381_1 /TAXON_ID=2916 /ORGANISM="Ceratium fusus, Strain PA161109" /LENGTH=263 /DNA_ID=CAMNT_0013772159 /DNA_START=1 /DNA_END=790 /DNA_ORIENTATION=+